MEVRIAFYRLNTLSSILASMNYSTDTVIIREVVIYYGMIQNKSTPASSFKFVVTLKLNKVSKNALKF